MRFLEDKQIEPEVCVSNLGKRKNAWADFQSASHQLDALYNGIVFKPLPRLDDAGFEVDTTVFGDICERLAAENSPYNFDAIPIHILGSIYERFLGSVIRATAKQAKVEEKPEVRKAGGVYYTPEYIVRYIVAQTVGKQIAGKTPDEISKMRFADIACGSGSFLLGIYDELLRYHAEWYNQPRRKKQAKAAGCVATENGGWQLSLAQRRAILQNNLYGVDLDRQAVEVAQLSLFLKLLEDERATSVQQYLLDFEKNKHMKKLLPDLSSNIVCGNSLISWDIAGIAGLNAEDELRLNPLDFRDAFPKVMRSGGFDAIVGNPPYGAKLSSQEHKYFYANYKFAEYQIDSYLLFLEKAYTCLQKRGLLGFIIPNTWLLNLRTPRTRAILLDSMQVEHLVHYIRPVFEQATVDTEVVIFRKQTPSPEHAVQITFIEKNGAKSFYSIPQNRWQSETGRPINIHERPEFSALADKLRVMPRLDDAVKITQGAKPFQVGKGIPPQTRIIVNQKPFVSKTQQDRTFRPLLRGSLIQRYCISWNNDYWISFGDWLAEPRYSAGYDAPEKIVVRQTGDSLVATIDTQQFVVRDNLYTILPKHNLISLKPVLALLNSKLLRWIYQHLVNPEQGEALAQVKRGHLASLPFPISLDDATQKKLTALVDQMLEAKKREPATSSQAKEVASRKCTALERQIDELVYELYGLTEEEIKLVENGAAHA
jgi:type I restriction-modification system DNA methylase subunit